MELMPVIRIASRPIQPASANEISVLKRYKPVAYARRPGHAGSKSKVSMVSKSFFAYQRTRAAKSK